MLTCYKMRYFCMFTQLPSSVALFVTGYYVFIEASIPQTQGDKARLVGPNFSQSSSPKCLQFWYHMYGSSIGFLRVFAKWGAGNQSEALVWRLNGLQGNQWNFGRVSVSRNTAYRVGICLP